MDPDETLKKIRSLSSDVQEGIKELEQVDQGESEADAATILDNIKSDAEDLATAAFDLDQWLIGGGFLPRSWKKASKRG